MIRASFPQVGLFSCLVFSACTLSAKQNPIVSPYQQTVDAFAALVHNLPRPAHFDVHRDAEPVRTGEEFDVNRYFSVLDHLSMQPGYVLDYVYHADWMGAAPRLYARPADMPRFRTASEYRAAANQSSYAFLEHVQTDGTAAGFFQLTVLQIMGEQFYLWWHALYNDSTIICDRTGLLAVLGKGGLFAGVPAEVQARAEQGDLDARVEWTDDAATVRVAVFTGWGGLREKRYTYRRSFPHSLLGQESQTLVRYDCGIRF